MESCPKMWHVRCPHYTDGCKDESSKECVYILLSTSNVIALKSMIKAENIETLSFPENIKSFLQRVEAD